MDLQKEMHQDSLNVIHNVFNFFFSEHTTLEALQHRIYIKYLSEKKLLNMNLNLSVSRIFFSVTFGFSFHYMT